MLDVRNFNLMQVPCPTEKCEDCPLNHYGMTCTSHRVEYWESRKESRNEKSNNQA